MNKALRWFSAALLIVVLTAFAFRGAVSVSAQEIAREDTVIFDIDGGAVTNPTNFNWMVPGSSRNQGMHQSVWEPLFILNYETGVIQPWLGLSFEPNESLDVWTLRLRDGVRWSDGEAFNADDIVFTIELLLGDSTVTLGGAASMQQWVASIEKVDDLTVRFNLKNPNPFFQLNFFSVRIFGGIVFLPEHVWAGQDPYTFTNYDPEKGWPLGTGAYRLVSASETRFVYDRRDDWWGVEAGFDDLPEPLRLIWVVTGNEENRALLMSNGELDSAMDMTLGAFEAIQARNPNVIAWSSDLPYIWYDPCPRQLSLNNAIAPWDDPEMRRAVNLMIDRQQIVAIAYEGTSAPSRTMFTEYGALMPFVNAIGEAGMWLSPQADVESASAILEEKGYTRNAAGFYERDGSVLSLDIQVSESAIDVRRIANVLVEQFRAGGIDATTRALAGGTLNDNKALGNFEAGVDWDACGSVNEPWFSLNRIHPQYAVAIGERSPGNLNMVRWSSEAAQRYGELVNQIGTLPLGDPRVVPLVVEAYTLLYAELPFIPLVQGRKLVPFDTTYWTGWPTAENNYLHPPTWWHSTHQIIHNLTRSQ